MSVTKQQTNIVWLSHNIHWKTRKKNILKENHRHSKTDMASHTPIDSSIERNRTPPNWKLQQTRSIKHAHVPMGGTQQWLKRV